MKPAEELLYDSEASLRLVDHVIEELGSSGAEMDGEAHTFLDHVMAQQGGLAELSRTLLRAYAESATIVQRIHESCGLIDKTDSDRLRQMHGSLNQVSSVTEIAATGILNAVGRANELAGRLNDASDADRPRMIASLQEELGELSNHLQFQDITAQQLNYVASLLADMRVRIAQVIRIFSPGAIDSAKVSTGPATDPNAPSLRSTSDESGQAVADELFSAKSERKTA
jgi:hypothetical protein